jgi:hypothetical protein
VFTWLSTVSKSAGVELVRLRAVESQRLAGSGRSPSRAVTSSISSSAMVKITVIG